MAIKKFYVSRERPGYPFDRKLKRYFSWGIDIWVNGKRMEARGFLTKDDAEKAVIEIKKQAINRRFGFVVSADIPCLIELFQKKLDSMEGSDRVRAKRVFKRLLELVPPKMLVPDLRTAHLQLYVEARQKDVDERTGEKITNETIRRELVPIVSALKSAYKYFESLDDYEPPRIPRPRVEKGRKERVISKKEQDGLFAYFFAQRAQNETQSAYENRLRTGHFLKFCLLTLSRPGEIAALKNDDIDLDQNIVTIRGTKTRFKTAVSVRRLMITPTMRQILEERFKAAEGDYLFTRNGNVSPAMYEHMKAACESVGVRYGRTDKEAISFHTARHTGITMLLQSGIDLKTVGRMAGHSDPQMTLYYTHSSSEMLQKASEILEQKMGYLGGFEDWPDEVDE